LDDPDITKEEAWQKVLIKFPPETIKAPQEIAKRARRECSVCGAPMYDFKIIKDKEGGERKVLQLSDCIHREKNISPLNPQIEEDIRTKEDPQLELDMITTKNEDELSRRTLRRKYNKFRDILIETNIDEKEIPTFGEFIAARMYEGVEDEQAAVDSTGMPSYEFGAGGGGDVGIGDYLGMGDGGDMYGHGGTGGGEGPGGSYSIFSIDYSRPPALAALEKKAQGTYGSLIKAKCPKCKRWIRTTTAQYVARGHRIRCPKHGKVKPKRFRMVSLSELFKKMAMAPPPGVPFYNTVFQRDLGTPPHQIFPQEERDRLKESISKDWKVFEATRNLDLLYVMYKKNIILTRFPQAQKIINYVLNISKPPGRKKMIKFIKNKVDNNEFPLAYWFAEIIGEKGLVGRFKQMGATEILNEVSESDVKEDIYRKIDLKESSDEVIVGFDPGLETGWVVTKGIKLLDQGSVMTKQMEIVELCSSLQSKYNPTSWVFEVAGNNREKRFINIVIGTLANAFSKQESMNYRQALKEATLRVKLVDVQRMRHLLEQYFNRAETSLYQKPDVDLPLRSKKQTHWFLKNYFNMPQLSFHVMDAFFVAWAYSVFHGTNIADRFSLSRREAA